MIGAAMYYALMAAASAPKLPVQIILTSGTQWTVPADWNSANNKIEGIGAGYYGGGAYAKKNNLTLTAGANVAVHIGATSTTQTVADTWLVSATTVKAAGSISTTGGQAASCIGDVKYSGGSGSPSGGGGAAGPNGAGLPYSSTTGGAGDAGFGGAGGAGGASGQSGTEWGTAGSGGGGSDGGNGGSFGGGSGGGATTGLGVIVITYTPA